MQVFARPSRSADESTAIPGTAAPAKVDAFKAELRELRSTEQTADYLDVKKRVLASPIEAGNPKLDAGVGFAGGNQGSFKRTDAANIGQGTVAGVWAYQGSKPFIANGRMFSSMGDTVSCVNPARDKVIWKKTLKGKNSKEKEEVLDSVLTPPALVNGKVFLGTIHGQVVCLSAESGQLLWTVSVGEPVQFQPAVANGRVYVATSSGHLYCIETGDTRDDGWLMWGANAAHNGLSK
jgi:outer membrane protein assembly factor BamB